MRTHERAFARGLASLLAVAGACSDDVQQDASTTATASTPGSTTAGPADTEDTPTGGDAGPGSDGGPGSSEATGDEGPDEMPPPPPSDNVIDVALWPRLIAEGWTDLPMASTEELCRRMSLDLTGSIPTEAEFAASCEGKTAAEMADAFMATPAFVAREQKLWVQHLRADPRNILADHLLEVDAFIAGLAGGQLGYDDFAAKILAHPITAIYRYVDKVDRYEDAAENAFRVFLGRTPVGYETADMTRLFRAWRRSWEPRYEVGYGYYVYVAELDPGACMDPIYGPQACTSSQLGEPTEISLPLDAPVLYETFLGDVPADLQTELEQTGRLLATRPEFWDEAADHALRRYLGWWKTSAAEPDTDVPEVRAALSQWFAASDHDIRGLYKTIVTSIIYARSAEVDPSLPGDPSPWSHGPTRAMESTQFLDSLEKVFARELGFCDIHTDEPVGRNWFWPDRLRVPQAADYYGFGYDFYFENGVNLGGCIGPAAEAPQPGMTALFAHIDLGKALCAGAGAPVPDGFDVADESETNVQDLIEHQFRRFLTRSPHPEEEAALMSAAGTCTGDDACGLAVYAEELCGSLLRSSAFLFH